MIKTDHFSRLGGKGQRYDWNVPFSESPLRSHLVENRRRFEGLISALYALEARLRREQKSFRRDLTERDAVIRRQWRQIKRLEGKLKEFARNGEDEGNGEKGAVKVTNEPDIVSCARESGNVPAAISVENGKNSSPMNGRNSSSSERNRRSVEENNFSTGTYFSSNETRPSVVGTNSSINGYLSKSRGYRSIDGKHHPTEERNYSAMMETNPATDEGNFSTTAGTNSTEESISGSNIAINDGRDGLRGQNCGINDGPRDSSATDGDSSIPTRNLSINGRNSSTNEGNSFVRLENSSTNAPSAAAAAAADNGQNYFKNARNSGISRKNFFPETATDSRICGKNSPKSVSSSKESPRKILQEVTRGKDVNAVLKCVQEILQGRDSSNCQGVKMKRKLANNKNGRKIERKAVLFSIEENAESDTEEGDHREGSKILQTVSTLLQESDEETNAVTSVSKIVQRFEVLGGGDGGNVVKSTFCPDLRTNFEEFHLVDGEIESTCVNKIINGRLEADGEEIQRPKYDKFLEATGLSEKSILTPSRMLSNHRNMMKPKDIKYRNRIKSNTTTAATTADPANPTVKYWSEAYL